MVPLFMRAMTARGILAISPESWTNWAKIFRIAVPNFGDKIHKGAGALRSRNTIELYQYFISHFGQPENFLISPKNTGFEKLPIEQNKLGAIDCMMLNDLLHYLPDDILVKVDRAAMAVSLETRVPFLDHRVVEFAAQLPLNYKLRNNQSKWILRKILYKYVPKELIERPKMGFGIPLETWLRGPLRDWAESLLNYKRIEAEGFFNALSVQQLWLEHLSGKRNWSYHLWDILMFQMWLDEHNE